MLDVFMDRPYGEPKDHHYGCLALGILLQFTVFSRKMVDQTQMASSVKSCSTVVGRHEEYE